MVHLLLSLYRVIAPLFPIKICLCPPDPAQLGGEIPPGVAAQTVLAHRLAVQLEIGVAGVKLPPAQAAPLLPRGLKNAFRRVRSILS